MEFEVIETKRLILKKLTPEILAAIFASYDEEETMKLLGLANHDELVREKEKTQGGYQTYDRTMVSFLLVLKENNVAIGRGGFHNWYKDHLKAELGYMINKEEYKRQGYMSEAVEAILYYGFYTMNLNRVEACISPNNVASLSIVKKFGFTKEGYLRQHYIREGEIQDTLIYAILKQEYKFGS